ncbi:MAG: phytoene/squalene synthase family protein [Martelella sp.]|uniref:phytoene/squalene synthase family protein n=1 Tax=unclassified Martelella TaxID=2629616 RepID=UPI000C59F96C|nr:phytoene/squalene synthase family protein [Martelella sp.]MAU23312.1 phytoene/squalene synthase family protein [Martelella sp.]
MAEAKQGPDPLLAELREADRDRYLAVLLSPEEHRPALTALYLFNAELARVRERISEPLPGEVRLQYWRDLLAGSGHGESQGNPLAARLLQTLETYRLPAAPLIGMSEARIFDLYDDPMGSLSEFEGYAGETASALIQLASLVLDSEKAAAASTAAGHAGVAQAVAGSLLLMSRHRANGQVFIPTEILSATGLDRESFLIASDRDRVGNAIRAFAGFGRSHLERFEAEGPVAREIAPAYLPISSCKNILVKAERLGENVLDNSIQPPQWKRQFAMMRSLLFRKF